MCFSAGASFAGGVLISAIGVASVRKVRKPTQRLFAVIPLLFGFQQFAEGVLWITLRSGEHAWLQSAVTYIFLITALVIWPVMIPLSMWFMEEIKKRKNILSGLIVTGCILSLFYAFCLISFNVTPQISGFHIQYVDNFPRTLVDTAFVFYLVSTMAPLFVSSVRRMWVFGILIFVSYIITGIFFAQYLTSVWCFFAALISVVIYWILAEFATKVHLRCINEPDR
ncbi:MAG: hypothetical protein PHE15_03565 [Dehalococcoidales bacterium]|nr:hypothetical protein [Dehalococcoidales bacterium]